MSQLNIGSILKKGKRVNAVLTQLNGLTAEDAVAVLSEAISLVEREMPRSEAAIDPRDRHSRTALSARAAR